MVRTEVTQQSVDARIGGDVSPASIAAATAAMDRSRADGMLRSGAAEVYKRAAIPDPRKDTLANATKLPITIGRERGAADLVLTLSSEGYGKSVVERLLGEMDKSPTVQLNRQRLISAIEILRASMADGEILGKYAAVASAEVVRSRILTAEERDELTTFPVAKSKSEGQRIFIQEFVKWPHVGDRLKGAAIAKFIDENFHLTSDDLKQYDPGPAAVRALMGLKDMPGRDKIQPLVRAMFSGTAKRFDLCLSLLVKPQVGVTRVMVADVVEVERLAERDSDRREQLAQLQARVSRTRDWLPLELVGTD